MALRLNDDLLAIFNTNEFAVSATYRRALTLSEATIKGLFDNETIPTDAGGFVPVHQENPQFTCRTIDVPNVAYNDMLIISGDTYAVRSWVHNGLGLTVLQLEKQ